MTKYIVAALMLVSSVALADKACDDAIAAEKRADAACKRAWRSCPRVKDMVVCSPEDVKENTRICKEAADLTAARQEACKQCQ